MNACDFNRENCAQTYIYITVFDFNDEVPIFERSHLSENVLEDVDIGTSVVTVSARDRDVTPAYSSFTYVLLSVSKTNAGLVKNVSEIILMGLLLTPCPAEPGYTLCL